MSAAGEEQIVQETQPLALKPRKAGGRRLFQRQRLRLLNYLFLPGGGHSALRRSCAFSPSWTAPRAFLARLVPSCGVRGSIPLRLPIGGGRERLEPMKD